VENIRIGIAADILGVSVDKLRKLIKDGLLNEERTSGGHRVINTGELADFLNLNLSSSSNYLPKLSARNKFLGLVTNVKSDTVMSQVDLISGNKRIVSLMTTEAVRDLNLVKGTIAIASTKASAITVEVVENL
jgi:molybdopterin-binding protein